MTGDMHQHATPHPAPAPGEAPRAFFRPKPDGSTDPAGEAGWYLERERERRGLSLQTASRATGVHPQHLRAIELGMLENLPERAEALRMIAAYARFLGFDPQPLVAHFETCLPPERQQKAFSSARIIPFPLIERLRDISRTPAGIGAAVLTVTVLFGSLGWALWPAADGSTSATSRLVAEAQAPAAPTGQPVAPGRHAAVATAPDKADRAADGRAREDGSPAAGSPDPIAALIARTVPQVQDEASPAAAGGGDAAQRIATGNATAPVAPPADDARSLPLPPPPAAGQPASAPQADAPAAATPPLAPQPVQPLDHVPPRGIALRAAEQIWIRLEDDDGLPWFVGFLKAGQVLALPADRSLRLSASDVHRLEWYVNGQRMGRLGKRGADFLSEPLSGLYKQSGLKVPGTTAGNASAG